MSLPKTAVGLVSLMVFVGYLLYLVFGGSYQNTLSDTVTTTQTNIVSASAGLGSGNLGIYGSVSAVFSIFFNLGIAVLIFLAGIFLSLSGFIAAMTLLPLVISQILLAIVSIGLLFALLSKVIQI